MSDTPTVHPEVLTRYKAMKSGKAYPDVYWTGGVLFTLCDDLSDQLVKSLATIEQLTQENAELKREPYVQKQQAILIEELQPKADAFDVLEGWVAADVDVQMFQGIGTANRYVIYAGTKEGEPEGICLKGRDLLTAIAQAEGE